MNINVGNPRLATGTRMSTFENSITSWYDDQSYPIELWSFDGHLDEIDDETCNTLPLECSAPTEDWTAPIDDVETHRRVPRG